MDAGLPVPQTAGLHQAEAGCKAAQILRASSDCVSTSVTMLGSCVVAPA